ncbi:hypothetical protein EJ04DRAFT_469166 [Polyplosphaeria fusca]|uniref:Inositolphosphotransferase Aur1/Ipt1 domain-containing protein n=1 Tax=Polyplosphaeria fusca TaxID=682080 RepID=A0A9P4QY10_9PLEO|nr:hypothetical protein EJ04DRAFT_469166 [Polyplosphaeria fusca]
MPDTELNYTMPDFTGNQQFHSMPAWKLPGWVEPLVVASILFSFMFLTRRRNFSIASWSKTDSGILDSVDSTGSRDRLLGYEEGDSEHEDYITTSKHLPKRRNCFGTTVFLPNTTRFRNNIHSRLLQKFPFLIEMFYWIINYAFYRCTSIASQALFAKTGIWDVAQEHGLAVLEAEEFSVLSIFFPIRELDVQQWFMRDHQNALTFLNRAYALIHIPGTVGFICWYYYVAPSFNTFATVRRTMTLTNFMAFTTFIFYPCMPPRLLPKEYGFLDTVRHDDAESVWMSGKFVNTLAAMPSMHFGYSFCIGMTLVYHSGVFRRSLEPGESKKNAFWKMFYFIVGLGYPTFLLVTIVSTANHYFMDALVATCFVFISFYCNKIFYVFIPLEDLLLWAIRADKPAPTTGDRFHERGGRL